MQNPQWVSSGSTIQRLLWHALVSKMPHLVFPLLQSTHGQIIPRICCHKQFHTRLNEDCLCLNIWSPLNRFQDPDQPLILVMMWLYWESLNTGTAIPEVYGGCFLSKSEHVVVVSIKKAWVSCHCQGVMILRAMQVCFPRGWPLSGLWKTMLLLGVTHPLWLFLKWVLVLNLLCTMCFLWGSIDCLDVQFCKVAHKVLALTAHLDNELLTCLCAVGP